MGENIIAEKSSKAKIVPDEKILALLCEGGETSLVRPELTILTSSPPSSTPHPQEKARRNRLGRLLHIVMV